MDSLYQNPWIHLCLLIPSFFSSSTVIVNLLNTSSVALLGLLSRVSQPTLFRTKDAYTARSGEYEIKLLANDFQLYYALFDRLEAKRTNKELKLPNWTPTTRTCAHVLHEVTLLQFWLVNRFIFVNFVYRVRRAEDKRDNWLTPTDLVFVISGYKSCFPEILVHSPKGKQKYYAEGLAEI